MVSCLSIASWVISRVLDAVRPAPEDLAVPELRDVGSRRLGQHDDVAPGHQLGPRQDAADLGGQLGIADPELPAVALLEEDAGAELLLDPAEVQRVDREPELVLLA